MMIYVEMTPQIIIGIIKIPPEAKVDNIFTP